MKKSLVSVVFDVNVWCTQCYELLSWAEFTNKHFKHKFPFKLSNNRTYPAACGCSITTFLGDSTWSCSSSVLLPTMDRLVQHIQQPQNNEYLFSHSTTVTSFIFSVDRDFSPLLFLGWTNIWFCRHSKGKEYLCYKAKSVFRGSPTHIMPYPLCV